MMEVRPLATLEEFTAAVGLQKEIWGFEDIELLPLRLFVVATKIDAAQDASRVESLRAMASERGLPFYAISSVTGAGIEELKRAIGAAVLKPAEA